MSKDEHAKGKGLAIGAAIGAVAGVITGILFAPKSGKETRDDVKNAAVKAKAKLEEESNMVHKELTKAIDKVETLIKEKGSVVSEKAKESVKIAIDAKESLNARVRDFKSGNVSAEAQLKEAVKSAEKAQSELAKLLKK